MARLQVLVGQFVHNSLEATPSGHDTVRDRLNHLGNTHSWIDEHLVIAGEIRLAVVPVPPSPEGSGDNDRDKSGEEQSYSPLFHFLALLFPLRRIVSPSLG